MIYDNIKNAGQYMGISEGIGKALRYLMNFDSGDFEEGIVEIDGDKVYAVSAAYETKPLSEGKNEAHRKYIDVQFMAGGRELIMAGDSTGMTVSEDYDEAKDVLFYEGTPDSRLMMQQGGFAVFFPWDAHMPGIEPVSGRNGVKKIVVKVHV